MENQFVPYEIALELKELGFNELCLARLDGGGFQMLPVYDPLRNSEIKEPWFCVIPLWQQAFDWFRDDFNHNTFIRPYSTYQKEDIFWEFVIEGDKNYSGYKTYEEAREACLIKLIEVCKSK